MTAYSHLTLFSILLLLFMVASEVGLLTQVNAQQQAPVSEEAITEAAKEPKSESDAPSENAEMEMSDEAKQAEAKFKQVKQRFADSVLQMREIHTRYVNGEQQTPKDAQRFRQARHESRDLIDEMFNASYELLLLAPHEEAAQFLLTMLEHQYSNTTYNLLTMQAGALLLDLGFQQTYLYQTVARSSVCSGEFKTAETIYEYLAKEENPDLFGDLDKRFFFQMDELKEQWAEEELRRETDAQSNLPRVLLKTTKGDMVIELFLNEAPSTVANFVALVEEGFYDGLDFYQVIDDLLALTGDETGAGSGNSGRFIVDEHNRPDSRNAFRGSLAMAKLPKGDSGDFVEDSGSSQFAIFLTPVPTVRQHQTVFGRVIEGLDGFSELRRIDPSKEKKKNEIVLPPDRIIEATVIRKPDDMPDPVYRYEEPPAIAG